ncbi:MAG: prepilin-type N-terminal cleavage/methylation domain-containing protein [Acidobacteria bacterium]|nr:prepilin-type N-terminal cleavage/methylation domain-containing protein [Acidobacteriota bacterium]
MSKAGFSLIELMIVLAVMTILAAIAVPSFLNARMAANEGAAIQTLRTIVSAEVVYSQLHTDQFGTFQQLVDEKYLDERFVSSQASNGYLYTENANVIGAPPVANIDTPNGYRINADPATPNTSGRWDYGVAADGVIRWGSAPPPNQTSGAPIG